MITLLPPSNSQALPQQDLCDPQMKTKHPGLIFLRLHVSKLDIFSLQTHIFTTVQCITLISKKKTEP